MIYIDATEARDDTRLPNASSYTSITGLERLTGADILVSPWEGLPEHLKDIPPHVQGLARHCWHGCLIQRKSGSDFIGSIRDLPGIEARMIAWSPNPWLMVTGVRQSSKGDLLVGNRLHKRTNTTWAGVSGALDAWCDRGGSHKCLYDDGCIPRWLDARQTRVFKWQDMPVREVVHKTAQQNLQVAEPNYYNTLRAFPPSIGPKRVENLAIHVAQVHGLPPSLLNVVALALSDAVLEVKLWGPQSLLAVREWYGVDQPVAWVTAESVISATGAFRLVGNLIAKDGRLFWEEEVYLGTMQDPVPELTKGAS